MVIILKIFLAILSIAFGYVSYFVISEFNKFRKTEESENASVFERLILGAVAFAGVSLLVLLSMFSILMILSTITITLPF